MQMNYEILTTRSILDIPYENDEQHEKDCAALVKEQNEIVSELCPSEYYKVHFIEDPYYCDDYVMYTTDLDEAIQYLAIKDGVDLVRFDNGKLGYVAYYTSHENCFEFEPWSKPEYSEGEE